MTGGGRVLVDKGISVCGTVFRGMGIHHRITAHFVLSYRLRSLLAPCVSTRGTAIAAGRTRQGPVVLYTSLAPTESGPLGEAFEKKTGIKVEIWRALSEKVVQRAITEAQRAAPRRRRGRDQRAGDGDARAREAASPSSTRRTSPTCRPAPIPKHRQWIPDR